MACVGGILLIAARIWRRVMHVFVIIFPLRLWLGNQRQRNQVV